jgi:hypothetical protein
MILGFFFINPTEAPDSRTEDVSILQRYLMTNKFHGVNDPTKSGFAESMTPRIWFPQGHGQRGRTAHFYALFNIKANSNNQLNSFSSKL